MNLAWKPANAAIGYMIENRDELVGRYCRHAKTFNCYYIATVSPDWIGLRVSGGGDQGRPEGRCHNHEWDQFARDYNMLPAPRGDAV